MLKNVSEAFPYLPFYFVANAKPFFERRNLLPYAIIAQYKYFAWQLSLNSAKFIINTLLTPWYFFSLMTNVDNQEEKVT